MVDQLSQTSTARASVSLVIKGAFKPTNDNECSVPTTPPVEAHGHAALLLVESLIHGLCEKAALSTDEAIAIAERAADVQRDYAEAADGAGAPMWRSHALLSHIAVSLRADEGGGLPPYLPA